MRLPLMALALTGTLLCSGLALAQSSSGSSGGDSSGGSSNKGSSQTTSPTTQGTDENTTAPATPAPPSAAAPAEPAPAPTAQAPAPMAQAPAKPMQGMKMKKAPRAHRRAAASGTCRSAAMAFDRMQQGGSISAAALDRATQLRNEGMTDCNSGNSKAGLAKLAQATRSLSSGS